MTSVKNYLQMKQNEMNYFDMKRNEIRYIDDLVDKILDIDLVKNDLKTIDSFWITFSNILLNNGFVVTDNPFVNMDYLHKRHNKCKEVFLFKMPLTNEAFLLKIEILLNNDNQIVMQFLLEINGIIECEKCKHFHIIEDDGVVSENEIYYIFSQLCEKLLEHNNIKKHYCKQLIEKLDFN